MKLLSYIILFLSFTIIAHAQSPFFIAIYEGSANYNAQIGGGHYELSYVNYSIDNENIYKVDLEFSKKKNKFVYITQEEIIYIQVLTPRHIRVVTDNSETYVSFPNGPTTITLQTQKGLVKLYFDLVNNYQNLP